jgi:uncharacterized RDD family membrane protein YckC
MADILDSNEMPVRPVEFAGFWPRVGAAIIDWIILSAFQYLVLAFMPLGSQEISGIMFFVNWLYFTLQESSQRQATIGKMALGIVVTDLNGERIGFAKATGRYFAKILSAIILLIGFIMVAFTEKKQGLHDILAGTLVVFRK